MHWPNFRLIVEVSGLLNRLWKYLDSTSRHFQQLQDDVEAAKTNVREMWKTYCDSMRKMLETEQRICAFTSMYGTTAPAVGDC